MHRFVVVAASLFALRSPAIAQLPSTVVPGTISVGRTHVASVYDSALDMGVPPGDANRLFVAAQRGYVSLIRNGVFVSQPYLDISFGFGLINAGERGLLGMAFHPGFNTALSPGYGKFYTYTSETKVGNADFFRPDLGPTGGSHHNVVREWSVDPAADTVASVGTASRVLFRIAHPATIHNAGSVKFGPDGMLYVSVGDGATGMNAQNLALIFGKIIRIDPTAPQPANGRYGIPADNPFAAPGDPGLDEIYAYGLRNPFRTSFDRLTGALYLGDVGEGRLEEVDKIVAGGNYGWPYFEGTLPSQAPPAGFESIPPLAQYSQDFGRSVIGGFIYRGAAIPELYGKYVFADAFSPSSVPGLRYMEATGGQIYSLNLPPGSPPAFGIYGFGEDSAGELYTLASGGGVSRLTAVPEPNAALSLFAIFGSAGIIRRRSV